MEYRIITKATILMALSVTFLGSSVVHAKRLSQINSQTVLALGQIIGKQEFTSTTMMFHVVYNNNYFICFGSFLEEKSHVDCFDAN